MNPTTNSACVCSWVIYAIESTVVTCHLESQNSELSPCFHTATVHVAGDITGTFPSICASSMVPNTKGWTVEIWSFLSLTHTVVDWSGCMLSNLDQSMHIFSAYTEWEHRQHTGDPLWCVCTPYKSCLWKYVVKVITLYKVNTCTTQLSLWGKVIYNVVTIWLW